MPTNWYRCNLEQSSCVIPEGQVVTPRIPFTISAQESDGAGDSTRSADLTMLDYAEDGSFTTEAVYLAASGWQAVDVIHMRGGTARGYITFRILKTYRPDLPFMDVAMKCVDQDGIVGQNSERHCRVTLPKSFFQRAHSIQIQRADGSMMFEDQDIASLAGITIKVDGQGVWSPPVDPFVNLR